MEVIVAKVISFFVSLFVCVFFTLLPFKFSSKLHKKTSKPLQSYGSETTDDDNDSEKELEKDENGYSTQQKHVESNVENHKVLKLLMCVGGGVFLGTFLLHLLPEVRHDLHLEIDYPVPELLIFCGFLLMLATEFLVDVIKQTFLDPPHQHHETTHLSSPINPTTNRLSFRTVGLILALSFHHIFEGFVIGFQESSVEVMNLTVGVLIHEATLCFILGLQAVKTVHKLTFSTLLILVTFALIMPLGILIGALIVEYQPMTYEHGESDHKGNILIGVLQALSSGTFLYVTFFEILFENMIRIDESPHHVTHHHVVLRQNDDGDKNNKNKKSDNNNNNYNNNDDYNNNNGNNNNNNNNNNYNNNDNYNNNNGNNNNGNNNNGNNNNNNNDNDNNNKLNNNVVNNNNLLLHLHHHHEGNLTYRFLTIISFTSGFVLMSLLAMLPM